MFSSWAKVDAMSPSVVATSSLDVSGALEKGPTTMTMSNWGFDGTNRSARRLAEWVSTSKTSKMFILEGLSWKKNSMLLKQDSLIALLEEARLSAVLSSQQLNQNNYIPHIQKDIIIMMMTDDHDLSRVQYTVVRPLLWCCTPWPQRDKSVHRPLSHFLSSSLLHQSSSSSCWAPHFKSFYSQCVKSYR